MKFFCEYCGNRIDALKDSKCPNCGASYKKNASYKKIEEEMAQEKKINNENKQKLFDHVLGTLKFSRWFFLIPIVFFLIVFITIIFAFGRAGKSVNSQIENNKIENNKIDINDTKEQIEDIFDSFGKEEKQEMVTANFNEFASTKNYKVKVERYEIIEDVFKKAEDGYELVKFHLLVENLTDKAIDSEDVNCIVDGIAQNNYYYAGHSDLPFDISIGLTVKGTATFIVPKNAASYDIKYGDYVTIHIEK